MEAILAEVSVSMSEFKKNPAAVLREANTESESSTGPLSLLG